MAENKINYCKADNKQLNFECPSCSFFKRMDEDIYNFFKAYTQALYKLKNGRYTNP